MAIDNKNLEEYQSDLQEEEIIKETEAQESFYRAETGKPKPGGEEEDDEGGGGIDPVEPWDPRDPVPNDGDDGDDGDGPDDPPPPPPPPPGGPDTTVTSQGTIRNIIRTNNVGENLNVIKRKILNPYRTNNPWSRPSFTRKTKIVNTKKRR